MTSRAPHVTLPLTTDEDQHLDRSSLTMAGSNADFADRWVFGVEGTVGVFIIEDGQQVFLSGQWLVASQTSSCSARPDTRGPTP